MLPFFDIGVATGKGEAIATDVDNPIGLCGGEHKLDATGNLRRRANGSKVSNLVQLIFDVDRLQPRPLRDHVVELMPCKAPDEVSSIKFYLLANKLKAVPVLMNRLWDLELKQPQ